MRSWKRTRARSITLPLLTGLSFVRGRSAVVVPGGKARAGTLGPSRGRVRGAAALGEGVGEVGHELIVVLACVVHLAAGL